MFSLATRTILLSERRQVEVEVVKVLFLIRISSEHVTMVLFGSPHPNPLPRGEGEISRLRSVGHSQRISKGFCGLVILSKRDMMTGRTSVVETRHDETFETGV